MGNGFEERNQVCSVFGPWEPVYFYLRNGQGEGFPFGAAWIPSWLDRVNSEETVARLADLGINLMIGHYWKGFGIEAEANHREATRRKIAACRSHGIRYIAYVQFASLMNETFFREVPRARNWIRIRPDGKPADYSPGWRPEPCGFQDDYLDYIERVFTQAIGEDGAGGIMLDNFNMHPCICGHCQKLFRVYVRGAGRFTAASLRLAYLDYDSLEIPRVLDPRNPLVREFYRFRMERMVAALKRLGAHIHKLAPDAIFMPNSAPVAADGAIRVLQESADRRLPIGAFDALKDDGAAYPVHRGNRFEGSIARFKLARHLGYVLASKAGLFGYRPNFSDPPKVAQDIWRMTSAALAFGGMPPAFNGLLIADPSSRGKVIGLDHPCVAEAAAAGAEFGRRWDALYRDVRPAAQTYVFRSIPSLAFTPVEALAALDAVTQECLREKIPFEFAFAEDLPDLRTETALIVADMLCLSDAEVSAILAYHRRGGRVIILGPSGWCDDELNERIELTLAALASSPAQRTAWQRGESARDERLFVEPTPRREAKKSSPSAPGFSIERREAVRLALLLDELLPNGRELKATGGPDVILDAYQRKDGAYLLHLSNQSEQPQTVTGLSVSLARIQSAQWVHDAEPRLEDLPVSRGVITLPPFMHYGVLIAFR